MPFVKAKGIDGLVFIPDTENSTHKKHPCRDCSACRNCSDSACRICLHTKSRNSGKNQSLASKTKKR